MSDFSEIILMFGDAFVSKDKIITVKKKSSDAAQITLSASDISLDKIRVEIGTAGWMNDKKLVIIEDLPNQKQVREFLLDIAKHPSENIKIIIWDSNNHIKKDPKTKKLNKTWGDFVDEFKAISGTKVVNNGEEFTHKDIDDCIRFAESVFKKYDKNISTDNIKLLIEIVGRDRGMLKSDIEKICLTAPNNIDTDFILGNAFPTSQEAVLYQFGNVLDSINYDESINMLERFLDSGVNSNVLAEIFMKKARWQLAATYFWASGVSWGNISSKLMSMGQFPAMIWHNPEIIDKKEMLADYQGFEGMINYMVNQNGIPRKYFPQVSSDNKSQQPKPKRGERIPFSFQADQTVNFVREKVVGNYCQDDPKVRQAVLFRALRVYQFVAKKLVDVRGNAKNAVDYLYEMTKVMTTVKL